jgi:hypothetical protein
LPEDFHIQLATRLLAHLQQAEARSPFARPRGKKSTPPLRDFVRESIERGMARQAQSAEYHEQAARAIMFVLPELAMTLAERAIQINPESGDAALTLGTVQALNNQPKQAEQSVRNAIRLARKAHDDSLRMMAEEILPLVRQPDILRAQLQLALSFAQLGNIGGLEGLLDDLNPNMFDLPDF